MNWIDTKQALPVTSGNFLVCDEFGDVLLAEFSLKTGKWYTGYYEPINVYYYIPVPPIPAAYAVNGGN